MTDILPTPLGTWVMETLDQHKAHQITVLDVQALTPWTDTLVICTATSSRHAQTLAEQVIKKAKKEGLQPLGVEGLSSAEWILVDLSELILHVMLTAQREWYQLEKLWTVSAQMLPTARDSTT